jgi:hypothetical protein
LPEDGITAQVTILQDKKALQPVGHHML